MWFIDMLQIMGIRIADDMAVFQIGVLLFLCVIVRHSFDFYAGYPAVVRIITQVG